MGSRTVRKGETMIRTLPAIAKGYTIWFETNGPERDVEAEFGNPAKLPYGAEPGMQVRDYCLAGLARSWCQVTNHALVTTVPACALSFYEWLVPQLPYGMTIEGGFKTSRVLPKGYFCAEASWKDLAELSRQIADVTGIPRCTLNDEGALKEFHYGREDIDPCRLQRALRYLARTGLEYVWYFPQPLTDTTESPDRRARTIELMGWIKEFVPLSVFFSSHLATPWRACNPLRQRGFHEMMHILDGGIIRRIYVSPVADAAHTGWYAPAKVAAAMEATPYAPRPSLWTGSADFALVGKEMAAL